MMPELMISSPEFRAATGQPDEVAVDLLFVPVFQNEDPLGDLQELDEVAAADIRRAHASGEFHGKPYELFFTGLAGGWKARRLALVGAGKREDADVERLLRVAAACGYCARSRTVESTGFVIADGMDVLVAAQAAADGLSMAEFDGGAYKRREDLEGRYPRRFVVSA